MADGRIKYTELYIITEIQWNIDICKINRCINKVLEHILKA